MKAKKAVVGVYTYLDDILSAIKNVKESGREFKVYSPTFIHELDHAISHKRSPVAVITLIGALTGLIGGFTLAIWAGLDYPLRVSAKDIVAPPAYVVIGYECTILFGAMATLTALFHFCRLPHIFRQVGYDPRFSYDKFGLVVACEKDEAESIESMMTDLSLIHI